MCVRSVKHVLVNAGNDYLVKCKYCTSLFKASNNSQISPREEGINLNKIYNSVSKTENSKTKQLTIPFICRENNGDQTETVLARLITVD